MSAAEESVLPDWMYEAVDADREMGDPEIRHVYEHRYIRVCFPRSLRCLNCRRLTEHRNLIDYYRGVRKYECSNCHTRIKLPREEEP